GVRRRGVRDAQRDQSQAERPGPPARGPSGRKAGGGGGGQAHGVLRRCPAMPATRWVNVAVRFGRAGGTPEGRPRRDGPPRSRAAPGGRVVTVVPALPVARPAVEQDRVTRWQNDQGDRAMTDSPRLRQLQEFLAETPDDPELRYAVAMEYLSLGDDAAAVQGFRDLIAASPRYVPTYLMLGQTLIRLGREGEAKDALRQGVAAAQQAGNTHALGELEALLDSV